MKRMAFASGSALLLALALLLRTPLESSMTAHMLVHIPLLALAGVLAGLALSRHAVAHPQGRPARQARRLQVWDAHGASGLLYASLTGMFWMIPKALDDVLLSPWVALAKFVSVVLAGIWLVPAWRRAHRVIRLFFVGGFCWVSAIVGMLYQDSTARLCNFYLLDDQAWAGRGLVILAVILPLAWLVAELLHHRTQTGTGKQAGAATPVQYRSQESS